VDHLAWVTPVRKAAGDEIAQAQTVVDLPQQEDTAVARELG
jgi:hypothetical protein